MPKKKVKKYTKRGQPTKYQPKYGKMIITECETGGNITTFAHSISVHKDSIYEWAKKHPEFSVALKRARQATFIWWYKLMRLAATGHKVKGAKYLPNLGAICFAMKNQSDWRDNPETVEEEVDELVFE